MERGHVVQSLQCSRFIHEWNWQSTSPDLFPCPSPHSYTIPEEALNPEKVCKAFVGLHSHQASCSIACQSTNVPPQLALTLPSSQMCQSAVPSFIYCTSSCHNATHASLYVVVKRGLCTAVARDNTENVTVTLWLFQSFCSWTGTLVVK